MTHPASPRTAVRWLTRATLVTTLAFGTVEASAQTDDQATRKANFPDYPLTLAEQGNFFVNLHYVAPNDTSSDHIMARQMYVSYKIPQHVTQKFSIVLIHGGGLTGAGFDATPDGREGWADFFVARGYKVYVVDQPARGRSAYHPEINGPYTAAGTAENLEKRFTAPEDFNLWPQAHLHTQWPGSGRIGNRIFDQFFASEVRGVPSDSQENLTQDAGAALLDRIGPAIILTHSQSGPHGWLIADARPNKVAAIVAVEPSGPPFHDVVQVGPPDWFEDGPLSRPWGITATSIHYSPAVTDPSQLTAVYQDAPDAPDLVRCYEQAEPARQLPTLKGIPIVIISSGAGYHRSYDHCTAKYLEQAGVPNTHINLDEHGIKGNGHMMMLEKNNLKIAGLIDDWLETHVGAGAATAAK